MNVLQLIDSLSVGGAERVAVNLFNGLNEKGTNCYLCTTRKEGDLKKFIDIQENYFFLKKKSKLDVKAILQLLRFCRSYNITIIHAHSTSIFLATIIKLFYNVKIIWHDHFGNSEFLDQRPVKLLKFIAPKISCIFSVNMDLKEWSKKTLKSKNVIYLPNYADLKKGNLETDLPGNNGYRIVCLANLRPQKDHFTLLHAFNKLVKLSDQYHLLLVGKDFKDDYSNRIKETITNLKLENNVHLLGVRTDIYGVLRSCDLGVLSSQSEGLPVSILEYGLAGLPVVATDVGEIRTVLLDGMVGRIVPSGDIDALYNEINILFCNIEKKNLLAKELNKHICNNYSKKTTIERIINVYKAVI